MFRRAYSKGYAGQPSHWTSSAALAERYRCLPREAPRFWNVQGQGSRGAAHGGGRSQTDRAAQLQEDLQACAEGAGHDSGKRNLTSSTGQHVRCLHQGMSCWLTLTDVAEQSLAISAINRHYCSRKAPHTCLLIKADMVGLKNTFSDLIRVICRWALPRSPRCTGRAEAPASLQMCSGWCLIWRAASTRWRARSACSL